MNDQDITPSAGRLLFWGYLVLALLIGGLGSWSVLATLSGAIVAQGQVEVSQSRQTVQHPDGGIVAEILVKEGEAVDSGEILIRLDGDQLRSELVIAQNQLLELAARRARLESERDGAEEIIFPPDLLAQAQSNEKIAELIQGQINLFATHVEALRQVTDQRKTRIEQIQSQISGLDAEEQALDRQIALSQADLETQQGLLSEGLTEAPRISALEREIAQLQGQKGELTASRAEAAGRITELEIEISGLATQQREKAESELRDIVAKETELNQRQLALAEKIARLDIRAPTSGLVLGLSVTTPQSVVRPADTLMYIVPQDRPLLVAARVPVTHIDEVKVGKDVRLVFSSLPSRTTPELHGTVVLISADALIDERSGISYYRAEISIDSQSLADLSGTGIIPGMPVESYIRTEDRTPLSYLLKPFTDYFRQALRET